MAKRKNGNHRSKSLTIPVAAVAGFIPLAGNIAAVAGQGLEPIGWMATQALTGYDTRTNQFWWPNMKKGAIPIIIGMLAHKIIGGKLGVNRILAQANIPFIRI